MKKPFEVVRNGIVVIEDRGMYCSRMGCSEVAAVWKKVDGHMWKFCKGCLKRSFK